jgi:hypothetical protein
MTISAVGKGCKKQMLFILPFILDRILTFLQDSVSNLMLQPQRLDIFSLHGYNIKFKTNAIIICLAS